MRVSVDLVVIGRAILLLLCCCSSVLAEVELPSQFGDNMVLQRDRPIHIWGRATPDESVSVTLQETTRTTTADSRGAWSLFLPPTSAGGPFSLVIEGENKIELQNVLVGDVWFCGGQSNMALGVVKTLNHDRETAAADFPQIRLFTTPEKYAPTPQTDAPAPWLVCSPKTVSYFSATAYYFGRELHRELDVPIGLVVSAVNGTRIEPWTPGEGVAAIEELEGVDEPTNGELYNGMIDPFTPMTIKGFIWYQGEGNVGDGMLYYHRQLALIAGWRKEWNFAEAPFYFVQLTPLNWGGKPKYYHAELWDAQRRTLDVPNTGMVVTTDIVGHVGEAHPRNKQEVGRRLSLWALAKTYGRDDLVYSGPLFREVKREGRTLRVSFDYAGKGLKTRDGKTVDWFTVVDADGNSEPAEVTIDGTTLLVASDKITEPVEVRFAWHQVAEPNLVNDSGLPASPFRARLPDSDTKP